MFFEHIMQAGDRVVYNADNESRSWGCAHHPNGALGTIVKRHRVERWYGRTGIDCFSVLQPGLYSFDAGAVVKWDDSDETTIESYNIDPADSTVYEERYEKLWVADTRDINIKRDELDNKLFVKPLPDTKFWEGVFLIGEQLLETDLGGTTVGDIA